MRRSFLAILISMALILCAVPALAQSDEIVQTCDGTAYDFDGDGAEETLNFTLGETDEYDEIHGFTIGIDGQWFAVDDTMMLAGDIYMIRLGYGVYYDPEFCWGTLFMVPEYGASDDPYTYCYLYTGGKLMDVGAIHSLPDGMKIGANGCITCQVRADHIGTWSRYAEFQLAHGYKWDDDGNFEEYYRLCEVPQDIYAMGMIVNLKQNIDLKASRFDDETTLRLEAGQQVILAASDDVCWLYVTDMQGAVGGWMRFNGDDYPEMAEVNGRWKNIDDVFANILYAD